MMRKVDFLIFDQRISYDESDIIFRLLFENLKNQILKKIDEYKIVFERIVDDVSYVELQLFLKVLATKKEGTDVRPFACEFKKRMHMEDYDFSLNRLKNISQEIRDDLSLFSTQELTDILEENKTILDYTYHSKAIEEYIRLQFEEDRKKSRITNSEVADFYRDKDYENLIEEFSVFGDFIDEDLAYVDEVIENIKWRIEYKNKDKKRQLFINLNNKTTYLLFDLIRRISESCVLGININPQYYNIDNYNSFWMNLDKMRERKEDYSAEQVFSNMRRFPLERTQYDIVLEKIGDKNKELTKYCSFWGIDLKPIKEQVIQNILKRCDGLDWNNEKRIQEIYNYIIQKKAFFSYDKNIEIEQKLKDALTQFDIKHRTVNGKLYETLEKAEEIKSRSFEGKEYPTKEEAEVVESEVTFIREKMKLPDFVERFRELENLFNTKWNTAEALVELEKADKRVREDYEKIYKDSTQCLAHRNKMLISIIVGLIITCSVTMNAGFLGVISLMISAIISIVQYKHWKKSKKAMEICQKVQVHQSKIDSSMQGVHTDETGGIYTDYGRKLDGVSKAERGGGLDKESAGDKARAERVTIEKTETERLEKEKLKTERLTQENIKRDIESRTVRGTVYKSLAEAERAKREHHIIDGLKFRLMQTKSQKERKQIFERFTEKIETIDANNRYELLRDKVTKKVPLSERLNFVYGISVLITFVVTIVLLVTVKGEASLLGKICIIWCLLGVWIWPVWKLVLVVKSKMKNSYKNIKKI